MDNSQNTTNILQLYHLCQKQEMNMAFKDKYWKTGVEDIFAYKGKKK